MLREEGDLVGDDAFDERRVIDLEVVGRIADRPAERRLGRDPAQSSSIFLTTVTDTVGFASFLGLASVLLPRFA